jgi:putative transposase
VGEIIVGDITHIRDENNKGNKVNSMIHNFWSFRYIINRLKTTAENFGIKVNSIEESYTSSYCPFCGSKGMRIYRGLFYCPRCDQVLNADVVGVLNIAKKYRAIIPSPIWDRDNGVLAHPLLLRIDDTSEGRSLMKMQRRIKPLEARIPLLK